MRPLLLSLCLALTGIAAADEPPDPAAYLAILTGSKLHYNFLTEPSRNPVEVQKCPRRDESRRVVQRGAEKSLIPWPMKPEVGKLLAEGETLFQARKYDDAAAKYKAALEADPESAAAYLFYGDTLLMGMEDPAAALSQYQKAVALDRTLPTAHFFSSTAYAQLGQKADAREEIVRALAYYPSYEAIWKIAVQSPQFWGIKPVTRHPFEPPRGYLGVNGAKGIDVFGGPKGEWLGYATCKAVWENESKFRNGHTPGQWSLEEEHACVLNQMFSVYNATGTKLEEQAKARGASAAGITQKDVVAALPPLEAHLFDALESNLLDGYILFEIIGRDCPISLSLMSDGARQAVEGYIRKYIIVAAVQ
jgi:tetratricopeptide (TPR) repeat protein